MEEASKEKVKTFETSAAYLADFKKQLEEALKVYEAAMEARNKAAEKKVEELQEEMDQLVQSHSKEEEEAQEAAVKY